MPKKLHSLFFVQIVVAVFLLIGNTHVLAAQISAEQIDSFASQIAIQKNGQILVREIIKYNFGQNQKHGIFRDIPIIFKADDGTHYLNINVLSVTDQTETPYQYVVTQNSSNLEIKIGDARELITGIHTYVIDYSVSGAISYYKDFDELYWNATGNSWPVTILQANTHVSLPQEIEGGQVKLACYYGPQGSTNKCLAEPNNQTKISSVDFREPGPLASGSGMTVAVGFPKGIIAVSSGMVTLGLLFYIKQFWIFMVPLLMLIFLWRHWYRYGRDPKTTGVIVPEYDVPEALSPLESVAVLNETITAADISAEIIYLATKGFISIRKIEKTGLINIFNRDDYELHYISNNVPDTDIDRFLVSSIFSLGGAKAGQITKLSDLKNTFYVFIPGLKERVFQSVVNKGYLVNNPERTQSKYWGIGLSILAFSFIFSVFLSALWGPYARIAGLCCAALFIFFSFIMPARAILGVKVRDRLLGLKLYLSVAEKDRLKFFNAPEKKPELFEKMLPYAMIFSVEKEWAMEFQSMYTQPPRWYADTNMTTFNTVIFANSLGSFRNQSSSMLASSPSGRGGSGGGGFSGGGGGGGGGGSW